VVISDSPRGVKRSWTFSAHPSVALGRVVITVKRGTNASGCLHDSMRPPVGSLLLLNIGGVFTPARSRSATRPVLLVAVESV